MHQSDLAMHYVCTHEQALESILAHDRFWVSNCGCRESRTGCARSRLDVCLMFTEEDPGSGSGRKSISLAEALEIHGEARAKLLVSRPFRNEARTETDGICFCCDDCCAYFLDPAARCDKGDLVQSTDFERCTHCEACVEVCYFKARSMQGAELKVEDGLCYGCGLCLDSCPEDAIRMVTRG